MGTFFRLPFDDGLERDGVREVDALYVRPEDLPADLLKLRIEGDPFCNPEGVGRRDLGAGTLFEKRAPEGFEAGVRVLHARDPEHPAHLLASGTSRAVPRHPQCEENAGRRKDDVLFPRPTGRGSEEVEPEAVVPGYEDGKGCRVRRRIGKHARILLGFSEGERIAERSVGLQTPETRSWQASEARACVSHPTSDDFEGTPDARRRAVLQAFNLRGLESPDKVGASLQVLIELDEEIRRDLIFDVPQ
jgi:hypothetical protein